MINWSLLLHCLKNKKETKKIIFGCERTFCTHPKEKKKLYCRSRLYWLGVADFFPFWSNKNGNLYWGSFVVWQRNAERKVALRIYCNMGVSIHLSNLEGVIIIFANGKDEQTDIWTDRQMDRQKNGQTDRWTSEEFVSNAQKNNLICLLG